jgi:hypothetical protein
MSVLFRALQVGALALVLTVAGAGTATAASSAPNSLPAPVESPEAPDRGLFVGVALDPDQKQAFIAAEADAREQAAAAGFVDCRVVDVLVLLHNHPEFPPPLWEVQVTIDCVR